MWDWLKRAAGWARREGPKIRTLTVAAVTLGVLTALLWPTIRRMLASGTYTPSRLGAGAIVAVTFFVIGLLVYFVAEKTLWELAELLIVPLALAVIGFWFTTQQDARQAETEEQRADDAALQAYLDQMSQLLLDKDRPLRQSEEGDEVQILARARTLTVLTRLDPNRKADVMQFLVEADLVQGDRDEQGRLQDPIISLEGANLSYVNLSDAGPSDAGSGDASPPPEPIPPDPSQQFQFPVQPVPPVQQQSGGAFPVGADLRGANLSDADLIGANLREANLEDARLNGADLRYANLEGVEGITKEELESQAKSLKGATMPNGQKYEDWLKSEGRGEDR